MILINIGKIYGYCRRWQPIVVLLELPCVTFVFLWYAATAVVTMYCNFIRNVGYYFIDIIKYLHISYVFI